MARVTEAMRQSPRMIEFLQKEENRTAAGFFGGFLIGYLDKDGNLRSGGTGPNIVTPEDFVRGMARVTEAMRQYPRMIEFLQKEENRTAAGFFGGFLISNLDKDGNLRSG